MVPAARGRPDRLLEPNDSTTRCSYKGIAHYWSLRRDGRVEKDVVWSYPDPLYAAEAVRGLLCFVDERVDLEVDDELQP